MNFLFSNFKWNIIIVYSWKYNIWKYICKIYFGIGFDNKRVVLIYFFNSIGLKLVFGENIWKWLK